VSNSEKHPSLLLYDNMELIAATECFIYVCVCVCVCVYTYIASGLFVISKKEEAVRINLIEDSKIWSHFVCTQKLSNSKWTNLFL